MGALITSTSSKENIISSSLSPSNLIYRYTLSTCYDSIFDVALSNKTNSILVSDDGRLRLFQINFENNQKLIESNDASTKTFHNEQIHDIAWSETLERFLVLTNKRLAMYDHENNLVNLNLQVEKGSPAFWRMTCWSSHLLLNLGLGASICYYRLDSSPYLCLHRWSRSSLEYDESDLLSGLSLSPQLTVAINVELSNNRHVIDLFSLSDTNQLQRLQRINSNQPCPLDVITSLRNYTWLCKSHWPSDDCLCLIESDGNVKKLQLEEQTGYILNVRLVNDRSHLVVVRTPSKLPKESSLTHSNEDSNSIQRGQKKTVGKLPSNLLLEIYRT